MQIEKSTAQHKAVIYARCATDRDSATSIEKQIRVCTDRATRDIWDISGSYIDSGISGLSPLEQRPGSNKLIRDARSKIFNILILDGLARLSRDNIELNMSIHLFESLGIRVIGVSDGYDSLSASQLFSGSMLKVMNEFFMEEHKEKIKRGKKHAALMRGHTDRCSHDKQVEPCQPSNPS